jgi:hypothetical protein
MIGMKKSQLQLAPHELYAQMKTEWVDEFMPRVMAASLRA